jgi:hypothetical protein
MKSMITKLFFFVLLFATMSSFAQDKIIKKDGKVVQVVIKEINDKQIKYVDYNDQDGIVFTIDKALVKEVVFSYGKKMEIKDNRKDVWYFADDKINNVMLNFSAFGGNTLGVAYERALKPGQSLMGEVKVYGIGIPNIDEVSRTGMAFDVYYRLKLKSLFSDNEYRPKHLLSGGYFAPNIGFSTGTYTYSDYYYDYANDTASDVYYKRSHSIFNLGVSYGKQWILQNILSIDASVGFHYFFGKVKDEDYKDGYSTLLLGNMWGSNNKLFSFSLRVGFLVGKDRIVK